MQNELSKKDKKIARVLIDKGVDIDFRISLEEVDEILMDWKKGVSDNRTCNYKLFKNVKDRDKLIANRYDGLTGSRYLNTVGSIYAEGYITEDDIKDFPGETKETLNRWLKFSKDIKSKA